jgi:hypothetical protein
MKSSDEYLAEAVQSLRMALSVLIDERLVRHEQRPQSLFLLDAIEGVKASGVARLLKLTEVAKILGISLSTTYVLVNSRSLAVVELGNERGKQRVSAIELQRYIDSRTNSK